MHYNGQNNISVTPPAFNPEKEINNNIKKLALALQDIELYKNYNDAYKAAKRLLSEMKPETPNRDDRIKLAKERIKSGYYNKKEILSQIADNLLKEFGFD